MSDWQPIETAPRDGSEFIGAWHHPNDGPNDPWRMAIIWWNDYEHQWQDDTCPDHYLDTSFPATHWMPLPLPPVME